MTWQNILLVVVALLQIPFFFFMTNQIRINMIIYDILSADSFLKDRERQNGKK